MTATLAPPVTASSWVDRAACRGRPPSMWFSESRIDQAAAAAICRSCPVREECLAAALREEADQQYTFGVRGGLSARRRRRLLDR